MAERNRAYMIPSVIWCNTQETLRIVVVRIAQGTADFAYERRTGSDSMNSPIWSKVTVLNETADFLNEFAYEAMEKMYPKWRSYNPSN